MTTYPPSTVPAAKQWLFGQMVSTLTAAPNNTFAVSYATQATTLSSPDDQVWFEDTTGRQVKQFAFVGNLGKGALYEEYDLNLLVTCYRAGAEGADDVTLEPAALAETRAWQLASAIEQIQRTDPTMGGALVTSRPNTIPNVNVDWDEARNGRTCTIPVSFHCESDI